MACPWDSTLYVESHYPAFNPRLKCPECSDRGALRVLRKADRTAAAVATPLVVAVAPAAARSTALLGVAPPIAVVWSPALLGVAPPITAHRFSMSTVVADIPPLAALPELNLVGLSLSCLCPYFAPTMALH